MNNTDKARILIVDDEKMNLKVLADLLKNEYAPVLARGGAQALQHIFGDFPPDLILLDVIMPEMGGYDVIKAIKNNEKTKNIPVIFVTALDSIEDEELGLRLGAVDYITKPYSPPIVQMRVRNHLRLVRQYKLLDKLAYLDGLTEIPNRRRFDELFIKEWKRSVRHKTNFSLAMLDVDFFKQYNDNYGHAMGDIALQKLAKALETVIKRPGDLIARYGGEEFVMMLPETDAEAAMVVADRALEEVNNLNIVHEYSQAAPHISISIGFVTLYGDDQITPATLLAIADKNLYRAKESGRNQTQASEAGEKYSLKSTCTPPL